MAVESTTKKRRLVEGTCVPTAATTSIQDSDLNPRKKTTPGNITSFVQYCRANFRGALQEYFQKCRPNFKLCFETAKEGKENIYVSTCKVDHALGVGRARSKKHATQLAAKDVIIKMGLVSDEESQRLCAQQDDFEVGTKEAVPIYENEQYNRENFRGALQEWFQKIGKDVTLLFETNPLVPKRFVSTCTVEGTSGRGEAGSKKKAIQLAAFDLICKLGLLTQEEIERQRERQKKPKEIRSFATQLSPNILSTKVIPPIIESEQYRKNNFRGVLQEYCQKVGGADALLNFDTIAKSHKSFVSTCVINGVEGIGEASNKKEAIQHCALDLIVKLGLLSQEEVEKQKEWKRESIKKGKGWKSAGLLYILPNTSAELLVDQFVVKKESKHEFRYLLAVPLSKLLARGDESCKLFKCHTKLCRIRMWMEENVPKDIATDFPDAKLCGGFPCRFFTKLSDQELLARLKSISSTHSAICGVESPQNSSRTHQRRCYRSIDMSFTGWGKRESQDKSEEETARRETLEESGIDIDEVCWKLKLRKFFYGQPLFIYIDMDIDESVQSEYQGTIINNVESSRVQIS